MSIRSRRHGKTKNYQTIGADRGALNLRRSIGVEPTALVTGDITRGEVVTITLDNEAGGTATVKPRRSGAILLDCTDNTQTYLGHYIDGNNLVVTFGGNATGTVTFWVF
jgi:hypothetical protein